MDRKLVEHFKSNMSKKLTEYVEHEWYEEVPIDGETGRSSGGFIAGTPGFGTGRLGERVKGGWEAIKDKLRKIRIPRLRRPINFPVNTPIPRERSIVLRGRV